MFKARIRRIKKTFPGSGRRQWNIMLLLVLHSHTRPLMMELEYIGGRQKISITSELYFVSGFSIKKNDLKAETGTVNLN